MRSLIKSVISVSLVLSALAVSLPAHASSLTTDQINAVLSLLQSFNVPTSTLNTVSAVLNHLPTPGEQMGTSTNMFPPGQFGKMACISLNRNIGRGEQGDDVRELQDMLRDDGDGFTASSTGFFGPLTAQAMMHFQMKNGIASTSTGFVGPLTRGFFERRCGEGLGKDDNKGEGNGQGDGMMGGTLAGTISGVGSSTIMVQITTPFMNASSTMTRTVNLTGSTTIELFMGTSTPATGSFSDLVVGKTVIVMGQPQADGSLSAQDIRVGFPPPPPPQMMQGNHQGEDSQGGNHHAGGDN